MVLIVKMSSRGVSSDSALVALGGILRGDSVGIRRQNVLVLELYASFVEVYCSNSPLDLHCYKTRHFLRYIIHSLTFSCS